MGQLVVWNVFHLRSCACGEGLRWRARPSGDDECVAFCHGSGLCGRISVCAINLAARHQRYSLRSYRALLAALSRALVAPAPHQYLAPHLACRCAATHLFAQSALCAGTAHASHRYQPLRVIKAHRRHLPLSLEYQYLINTSLIDAWLWSAAIITKGFR